MAAHARSAEQKTAKADAIARAALSLHREMRFEEWTVAQVARRAGVAKGTVFLYYESKEALGLAIAERLLGEWLDELDGRLAAPESPVTAAGLAQTIAGSLESRSVLRRTMALAGLMEHHAGRAAVAAYREWLLERSRRTGRLLEAALPFLRKGEGIRLLLLVQALVIGYHAMSEPAPAVAAGVAHSEPSPFRIDSRRAVAEALWMQLEGLRAARLTAAAPERARRR